MARVKKLFVIKEPVSMVIDRQQKALLTLDQLWPEILTWIVDNPSRGLNSLFQVFGPRCSLTLQRFKEGCCDRGYAKIRKQCKLSKGRQAKTGYKESVQLTEDFAASFQKRRKHEGIVHIGRMAKLVNNSMDVLEKENETILKEDNPLKQVMMVDGHIDRLSKLHKLATPVFDIDGASTEDKASANIAFLMQFNPTPIQQEDDVIEA